MQNNLISISFSKCSTIYGICVKKAQRILKKKTKKDICQNVNETIVSCAIMDTLNLLSIFSTF